MQTLQISQQKAFQLYPTASAEFKTMLEESFGKDFFKQKITDRVQGFSDIMEIAGVNPKDYELRPGETIDELAYRQAKLIALVYNEGTVLNASDKSQKKYYTWHEITPGSGFGLSCDDYVCWNTDSIVGVRLCFKDPNSAIDAGKKFLEIYANLKIK